VRLLNLGLKFSKIIFYTKSNLKKMKIIKWILFFLLKLNKTIMKRYYYGLNKTTRIELPLTINYKSQLKIGENCFIGKYSFFDCMGGLSIGDNTLIASNVFITTRNHIYSGENNINEQGFEIKEVIIGSGCWLGHGVIVLPGRIIGDRSIVAAGSIVTKNIGENQIWGGNPAKFIKLRNSF